MLEILESCPSCGHQSFQKQITCKDYTVSNENFDIVRCDKCTLLFTNPRPDSESIGSYYESSAYISHTNKAVSLIGVIYKAVRSLALRSKVSLINSISKKGNLLDYGCGTGHFLKAAKDNGWNVNGIEPNHMARNIAEKEMGQGIDSKLNLDINNQCYDIITLWHVLEHISDLRPTLQNLKERLNDSGKLIIAVPNPESKDAQHYREYWAAYDVPRHLYHFTQNSLAQLMHRLGLKVDKVLPMKFDSFYVSLLSEKHKNGTANYLKSFINGYKSNSYAQKHNNSYSSLIYIISKK